jgi:phosphoenolpyruvate carboxykinase (ATP)
MQDGGSPGAAVAAPTATAAAVDLSPAAAVVQNLAAPALFEHAVRRGEGLVSLDGALVATTGQHTGRSPNDKYFVREPSSESRLWWDGNQAMAPQRFDALLARLNRYLAGKELFVQDLHVNADPAYQRPVRFVTELAWHSLFARNMFIRDGARPAGNEAQTPFVTVVDVPGFRADPDVDGTRSDTVIVLNLARRLVLIGGSEYAGEMKKSVFTILNYLLPLEGVLPMHCSANVGAGDHAAIFFGLSGTGKTTLSADPSRTLVGDDEHGWSDAGVFNFEGGCYAKVIRLSPTAEPEIYRACHRFGTILENVVIDPQTRHLDLDDERLTENTRASYPIEYIANASPEGRCGHPTAVVMLTADAFGVLPPISRLTAAQAMYHFLLGYTARVAGTERGVTEPQATFSSCFGAPFLPLPPTTYGTMLADRIDRHGATVWLVNTGWTGGPYGVGQRMPIAHTRAMVNAAVSGQLDGVPFETDPIFGVAVPTRCPGVPDGVLQPRATWRDPDEYDRQARRVAREFAANFEPYAAGVSPEVRAAGPRP